MKKIFIVLTLSLVLAACSSPFKGYTVKKVPYTLIFPDGHSITIMHDVIDSAWTKH